MMLQLKRSRGSAALFGTLFLLLFLLISFPQDVQAQPFVSIDDVSVMEPASGQTPAVFTVTLTAPFSLDLTVSYETADGTATAPADYVAQMGDLVFTAGETSKTITIMVNSDASLEGTENYFVNLLGLSGFLGFDPTFGNRMDYSIEMFMDEDEEPQEAVNADFNGDGILDLAVTVRARYGMTTPNVAILFGVGDGTFGMLSHVITATMDEPRAIGTSDFNGDGIPDLVVLNYGSDTATILLGNGDGTFTEEPIGSPITLSGDEPRAVAIADFNADGDQDLAITIKDDDTVDILLGDGNGGFTPAAESPITVGYWPRGITSGDFNGDGRPDLAIANHVDEDITVLLGDGDGTFMEASMSPFDVDGGTRNIATADFNNDGILDLATPTLAFPDHTLSVLFGIGNGNFGAPTTFMVGDSPIWVAIADFNGDGKPDMAVANDDDDNVSILKNETPDGAGTPTFTNPTTLTVGLGPSGETIGDFNGNGKPDLAVVNRNDDDVTVWLNTTQIPMIDKGQGVGSIVEIEPTPSPVAVCLTGSGKVFGGSLNSSCSTCSLKKGPVLPTRSDYLMLFGILAAFALGGIFRARKN